MTKDKNLPESCEKNDLLEIKYKNAGKRVIINIFLHFCVISAEKREKNREESIVKIYKKFCGTE